MTEWIDDCSGCFNRRMVNKETGRCASCQFEWQEFRRRDRKRAMQNKFREFNPTEIVI